jgi:hypothetical protein
MHEKYPFEPTIAAIGTSGSGRMKWMGGGIGSLSEPLNQNQGSARKQRQPEEYEAAEGHAF